MKEGWKTVKLGEVCTFNKEQGMFSSLKYVGMEHIESGTGIVVGGLNSTEIKSNTFKFYRGDVLYGRLRPYLKKVFVAEHEGCCSTEIFPIKTTLNPYFLKYWFLSEEVTIKINKTCGGCRMPRANMNEVLTFYISFPPLEEQQRIVSILDASFEKIDALKKNAEENLKNAKAFYDKLLIEKFSHKEGWIKSTLQDECFKITDGTHQTPKYFESGHIFLSSGNVTNRKIDWDNIKFIDEQQHQEMQKRVSPKINDILLAKNGTTGVAAFVDRDVDFDIYVSLALLRTLGRITPQYMYYFVNSPIAKSQFNKRLKGAGVPNLHLTEIRQVEISYPKDIEKQNEIVKTIENIDEKCRRLEQIAQQTIRECDALKQSILRQAFSGEL